MLLHGTLVGVPGICGTGDRRQTTRRQTKATTGRDAGRPATVNATARPASPGGVRFGSPADRTERNQTAVRLVSRGPNRRTEQRAIGSVRPHTEPNRQRRTERRFGSTKRNRAEPAERKRCTFFVRTPRRATRRAHLHSIETPPEVHPFVLKSMAS